MRSLCVIFFFNDTATTEIYTLSLHDALPICFFHYMAFDGSRPVAIAALCRFEDRKSTRLNSSHMSISYAVFCLKKNTRLNSSHMSISYAVFCLKNTTLQLP